MNLLIFIRYVIAYLCAIAINSRTTAFMCWFSKSQENNYYIYHVLLKVYMVYMRDVIHQATDGAGVGVFTINQH